MIASINKKYDEQRNTEEKKQEEELAKRRTKLAIYDMAMAYGKGVMNIWADWATLPVVAGALTAVLTGLYGAQLAFVQKTKFAKGGILKGKSHAEGGIAMGNNQEAEGGEPILTKGVSRNPLLLKMASIVNQLAGGVDFANMSFSPVMARGGVTVPSVDNTSVFKRMIKAIESFEPVQLMGVSDRDIYRASISGRPKGAF